MNLCARRCLALSFVVISSLCGADFTMDDGADFDEYIAYISSRHGREMFALPDSDNNSLIWDRKDSLIGLNYDLDIAGGYSDLSAVSNNTLDFRDYYDTVHFLYGGYSERQVAIYNTLKISGGKIKQAVYGGSGLVAAEGNKVFISGGVFEKPEIYGGRSFRENAADNIVDIDKGADFKQSSQIYGGHSIGGNVEYNAVSIRKESGIKDGSRIVGGESQEGSAKGNEVDIDADALEAKVDIYGGISNEGEAKVNKVTINGGTFKPGSPIIGGRVGLSLLDATNKYGNHKRRNL
ncbi:hypothetical protein [Campylobacter showae]|uniref:hypothetical protein n=1 Tax=Campylobacter showae TaxID=204 RepID=UPI0028D75EAB|nr:hypothetical protein [Campylobacter showae]